MMCRLDDRVDDERTVNRKLNYSIDLISLARLVGTYECRVLDYLYRTVR